jgi:hypothetical protein
MPLFGEETDLIEVLVQNIRKDWKHIYNNVNVASYNFKDYWRKWFEGKGYPPAQPQIDIILVDSSHDLHGVEVKYFRMAISRITPSSYYEGIGEALALLKMGFWSVTLMHFFDEGIPLDVTNSYIRAASEVVSELNLPIGYSAFRVTNVSGNTVFFGLSPSLSDEPYLSEEPVLPRPSSKQNPLRKTDYATKMDDFIRQALRIPKPNYI